MKIILLFLFILISCAISLIIFPNSYASTCDVKETTLTTPQFYRVSDSVFIGTILSIDNYTDHQWKIKFNAEKVWKGTQNQTMTVMTNNLQACGYSLIKGEKYLVFTSGSPPYLISQFTKSYANAQNAISLFDDPKFQSEGITQEELNEKLKAAKIIIGNLMLNNTSGIPFNLVGVDVINSTLNIGIDNTKATMTKEEYEEKIKEIVGDVPMKIEFGTFSTNDNSTQSLSPLSVLSPLKQIKSGVEAKNVICKEGLQLVIRSEDNSSACVKPDTVNILIKRGWGHLP